MRSALAEFSAPEVMARGFADELAGSRARRTVAAYLTTGPLVGLLWLLTLAPSHWWRDGPAALWAAIPPAPAIGLACGVGALVLAATGRGSRWLSLSSGQIVHAAVVVVALAVFGDLLMLTLATRPDAGPAHRRSASLRSRLARFDSVSAFPLRPAASRSGAPSPADPCTAEPSLGIGCFRSSERRRCDHGVDRNTAETGRRDRPHPKPAPI